MRSLLLLVFAVVLLGPSVLSATTIDFEGLPSGLCRSIGQSVDTQDFRFTSGNGSGLFSCNASASNNVGANTSRALLDANNSAGASNPLMARIDGQPFDLLMFDAVSRFQPSFPSIIPATAVEVVGTISGGGTVSAVFDLDGNNETTLVLPAGFSDLISVSFLGLHDPNAEFLIDNVVVVPEPSTALLLAIGLFGFVGSAAQQRRVHESPIGGIDR